MSGLQDLLELQQLDLELERLEKQLKELPVFMQFKNLKIKAGDAKEELGWADTKYTEQQKRVKRMEEELQKVEDEQKVVQSNLYNDKNSSAKELEQLEKKSQSLGKDKTQQEEKLLAAMETADELQGVLTDAQTKFKEVRKQLKTMQQTGNDEIQQLKNQIAALKETREKRANKIDKQLLTEYVARRQRYNGRPLAVLRGDVCSGCRVSVSSNTTSQLNRPGIIINCENCGRLLVSLT